MYDSKNLIAGWNIFKSKTISLSISLLKDNMGKIITKLKESHLNFFGFEKEEDLDNIRKFMTNKFGIVHNEFIIKYINIGYTKILKKTRL